MTIFITILIFLGILGLVVIVHELGHLVTAKARGVRVHEFGIGFPPRLFAFKQGETEYSLNLIPLGGFTRLAGQEDPDEPRGLASKGTGTRLLVLSAGSVMNILLPIILLIIAFMVPRQVGEGVMIDEVLDGSPAQVAGIQDGDIVLSIDEEPISTITQLQQIINENLGSPVSIVLKRGETELPLILVPRTSPPEGEGPLGVSLTWANYVTESHPIWEAIPLGFKETGNMLAGLGRGVANVVTGREPLDLIGPIGMAQVTSQIVQSGAAYVLMWAAFLSMFIGIVNLLPIPLLDGGHIFFVLLEWIRRGKRISLRKQRYAQFVGLMLLLALIISVSYRDILRIIRGESLFR